jgi:hypothetical protein
VKHSGQNKKNRYADRLAAALFQTTPGKPPARGLGVMLQGKNVPW